MLLPRVIPCLLLKGLGLVKGVQFKDHRYIGDPMNAVQIFNTMEADEMLFLDILATAENRIPDLDLIQKIADQSLMPFGVGGGIQNTTHIRDILRAGAEKVCLNTYALKNPDLITEAANIFGRQSLVVSIDIKKHKKGHYEVYTNCGSKLFSEDLQGVCVLMQEKGAGEILLNSIDRDGTMSGYALEIISEMSKYINVPLIICGGAGTIRDLKDGIHIGHASAVAAGSMFVFHGPRRAVLISYPDAKELAEIRGE
ncbi:imidazole glycerol phosphate synthase subunit HisF [Candidatus Peregrinibacteria bacterium]|nr:imidazole glycerol phosphate synthase subunit HisF [Candidatus Peregrinibacteria bacterium]